MKQLFIVNGFPRAGKDTFMDHYAGLCTKDGLETHKHSTIDTVKMLAIAMGWNGEKTTENRVMLSELKDFYTKHFDGPLNEIQKILTVGYEYQDYDLIHTRNIDCLFTAMREPEEIARTVEWGSSEGIQCYTILVRGKFEEIDHSSHSDAKVLEYEYDEVIANRSTESDFLRTIDIIYKKM